MTKKNNTHEDTYGAIIVCVSQEEIQSHDLSIIRSVFSRLNAELIPAERNSVKIVVPLPDSEKRELVEIPQGMSCLLVGPSLLISNPFFLYRDI